MTLTPLLAVLIAGPGQTLQDAPRRYRLAKNPRRDPRALGYGSYRLTDRGTGDIVASFGWDERPGAADRLAEAEAWLGITADSSRTQESP